MKQDFSKTEKLKSKKLITDLFKSPNSIANKHIRLFFKKIPDVYASNQIGVSVSKRNFKSAVNRNRIKRLLREVYRLHKDEIKFPNNYAILILFVGKEMPSYELISEKYLELLQKINKQLSITN